MTSTTWNGLTPPLSTRWTHEVGPDTVLPEHPRPQLARPSVAAPVWRNLNGLWQYQPWNGTDPIPFGTDLPGRVLVPFPIESALSGVAEHADRMLYRTTVEIPGDLRRAGERLRLRFGAVNHRAVVHVNGHEVADHSGGYESFSADITDQLTGSGAQEIVVAVHSPVDSAHIPVGKQSLDPQGIFYTAASGIWQTVWLEPVAAVSAASVTATPDIDASTFTLTATFDGDAAGATTTVDVYDGETRVATASGPATEPLVIAIPDARFWSPDDPFLYRLAVAVASPSGTDRFESAAGLRRIAVDEIDGVQRLTLNREPLFLLSTLDQGYWPDGVYTAPTDEALAFDIRATKDLGFNTIRKHIKVEPARWYHWADTLGVLVWQDMPSLPTPSTATLTDADKAGFVDENRREVEQLKGVTSIIGWVPFNEGWGQWSIEAAAEEADRVKTQDPTRVVIARSGLNCCDMPGDPGNGDVIDWHLYTGPALPSPDASRAAIDGEHGGFTLPIEGHVWPGGDVNPYGAVDDEAALTAAYVENTRVLRDEGAPGGLSGAVYTQITDVEGEQNGLYTYDRAVLKVDRDAVRAVNLETIAAGGRRAG